MSIPVILNVVKNLKAFTFMFSDPSLRSGWHNWDDKK